MKTVMRDYKLPVENEKTINREKDCYSKIRELYITRLEREIIMRELEITIRDCRLVFRVFLSW